MWSLKPPRRLTGGRGGEAVEEDHRLGSHPLRSPVRTGRRCARQRGWALLSLAPGPRQKEPLDAVGRSGCKGASPGKSHPGRREPVTPRSVALPSRVLPCSSKTTRICS